MDLIKSINLTVRFLLELCALGALGYWGIQTGGSAIAKAGLGISAPLIVAVVWGTMVAPNAPVSVPNGARLALELIVFGAAVAALTAAGQAKLASLLAAAYVVNRVLMAMWEQ